MPAPWDRREDESPKAFAWFCTYRDLGATRRLVDAQKLHGVKAKSVCGGILKYSSTFDWQARVAAYDDWQDKIRQQGAEKVLREEGGAWEKSRKAWRRKETEVAELLYTKAKAALEHFSIKEVTAIDIARWLVIADRLFRLGANMPTEPGEDQALDSDAGLFRDAREMIESLPAGAAPSAMEDNTDKPEISMGDEVTEAQKAMDRPNRLRP